MDLASSQVTVMLPVKDMDRAREFYEAQLRLAPIGLRGDGSMVYRCGAAEIALMPRTEGTRAEHTAVSFRVHDIRAAVTEMEGRGVAFADYDLPGLRTVDHICVLGSEKAAWFNDTEGNILCLHEDLA
jgi:predicted enzyme related to lactoylglutathione lyase